MHRAFVIDTGLFVGIDRIRSTDFAHPVFQVVGRLVRAARRLHLDLKHCAELRHRVHAGDTNTAHVGQQFGKPLCHVGGFETARLPLVGDGLQSLLHFLGVGDLGVLPQGVDHLRCVSPFGTLTDHKFGGNRRVLQRLAQLHTRTDQLIDYVSDLIALHAGITGGRDDGS
ncbi:hypothetical protein ALQ87_200139 [Pseudomonas savastanoi pv. glycinea]|nr:hypothetical protein ALQ87_200139 [Pseudomonas savastanoi pv. glycinea]